MIKEFKDAYRFLSNFYTCEVEYEGEIYSSTEHAFQAAKFSDPEKRKCIQRCATAGQAKKLGQDPEGFRSDWHEVRVKIMHKILKEKFTRHKDLKTALLATENQVLQEGNLWHDSFWGVDLRTGRGLNKLGKLLMLLRRQFREEEND